MTRRLALALAQTHGSVGAWVFTAVGVALVLPVAFLYDFASGWLRDARLRAALGDDSVTCVCGAMTRLRRAALRCGRCGVVTVGHAWAPCDCGAFAHLACVCGRPLYHPAVDREGHP